MGRAAFDVFPARPIYYYLLPERVPSQHAAFFTRVALLAVNITCPDAEGIEPQSYTFVLPYPMAHDHVCQRGSFGLCAVRTFPSPCLLRSHTWPRNQLKAGQRLLSWTLSRCNQRTKVSVQSLQVPSWQPVRCQVSGCRTGQLAVLLLVRWPDRNLPGRP